MAEVLVYFGCNTVKLRRVPESSHYQVTVETHVMAQGNNRRYGKNVRDWVSAQPSSNLALVASTNAVHRLNGSGSRVALTHGGLRYSRPLGESHAIERKVWVTLDWRVRLGCGHLYDHVLEQAR